MLEIEEKLKNDPAGSYKKEILEQFNSFSMEVRKEINKGLAPEEFKRMSGLLQAVEAGVKVVEQY
ncbi:MAG: Unknown protein [uncultured Thiotrichaceae bacterium]|uniref:Uncharacterized protein n=1 Tax=uncultured Thiotrichaceae bacterium TaxID=298394 RepID=A0A6S6T9H4_9GAMM|nr:MAG: Unknown protein [uncultured Thiotrichaceae bacterium]